MKKKDKNKPNMCVYLEVAQLNMCGLRSVHTNPTQCKRYSFRRAFLTVSVHKNTLSVQMETSK